MNRKEIEEKREILWKKYQTAYVQDYNNLDEVIHPYLSEFTFEDHLIMCIDFLEWQLKEVKANENLAH